MNILLVGCGAMGNALRQGWIKQVKCQIKVVDPFLKDDPDIYKEQADLPKDFKPDVIVFAIKPQVAVDIIPQYSSFVANNSLFVSIMAGISTNSISKILGGKAIIVRAMPNLPATVGKGITGVFSSNALDEEKCHKIDTLFSAIGKLIWVNSETQLNLVTALSGSGPAYFFRFVELLAKAAEELGLAPEQAIELSQQTLIGAGALLDSSSKSATELKINVTSPGGTTAAALAVFDQANALEKIMEHAVQAAFTRAKELSQ